MRISLPVESYKGVDGSSLSPTRCSQIVQVYEMLEEFGIDSVIFTKIGDLEYSIDFCQLGTYDRFYGNPTDNEFIDLHEEDKDN